MEVKIQSVGFKADAKLKDFATKKINKLATFSDFLISAEVFFKVINTSNEENKETEIKISIPGNDLFAKKLAKSFEESVDKAVEALRRQIKKIKGKQEIQ
ncbi:MAG: ribosome-associated translation inhibitor RaiA [Bacteroidales bacterium]|nr:ribosome-associated translation inhibitor RaiA [Bacteroidales bacterium]HPY81867.1 ribosome-associated translation inhibitor RaiA [Bacteroidales bacterium]